MPEFSPWELCVAPPLLKSWDYISCRYPLHGRPTYIKNKRFSHTYCKHMCNICVRSSYHIKAPLCALLTAVLNLQFSESQAGKKMGILIYFWCVWYFHVLHAAKASYRLGWLSFVWTVCELVRAQGTFNCHCDLVRPFVPIPLGWVGSL